MAMFRAVLVSAIISKNMYCSTNKLALASLVLFLSGCATISSGTSQDIRISTEPPGARCALTRNGENLGEVLSTPDVIRVSRTKQDIEIICTKSGYQDSKYINKSDYSATLVGNAVGSIFAPVLIGVDSATGAVNAYSREVFIRLNQ